MAWKVKDFLVRFDEWSARDEPSPDSSLAMMVWIHKRGDEPQEGAEYRPEIDAWFAIVPEASDDTFASCVTYIIDVGAHEVRCSSIVTLRRPVF